MYINTAFIHATCYILHYNQATHCYTNMLARLHPTGSHWIYIGMTFIWLSSCCGIFEMGCSGKIKLLCVAMIHMIVCLILLLSNQSCSQENKYATLSWISICYSAWIMLFRWSAVLCYLCYYITSCLLSNNKVEGKRFYRKHFLQLQFKGYF